MLGVAKVPDILKNKNLQQNRRTTVVEEQRIVLDK
jgi:hypothetical protein